MDKTTRNFTIAWLGGIPIAILNAAIRNYLFKPYTNELLAHQISSFTIIIIFAIYFFWLNKLAHRQYSTSNYNRNHMVNSNNNL
jgi:undecaprenyl pyrophosphate phosphatase UppP